VSHVFSAETGAASAAQQRKTSRSLRTMDEHLTSLLAPGSFEAEQYRVLRHTVEVAHRTRGVKVVAVTSPVSGDGKTLTAVNLAGSLAHAPDSRVLLIDADLRRPTVSRCLGLPEVAGPGLVDAIIEPGYELDVIVRRRSPFNLSVLPAGARPTHSYEILQSPRLGEILAEARVRYTFVVVDTPPLLLVPDGRTLAEWVDGYLMVTAAHKTPRKLLEEALNVVDPTKLLGIVFNGDDRPLFGYSKYYRHYYQSPTNGHRPPWKGLFRSQTPPAPASSRR
jgi:capsular exopolysaccharide synthesis family protein